MGKLFGTDGARGIANSELTCELAVNIGRAAATVLAGHCRHRPRIVIGKDTRISSDMLEAALTAGLCSVGADVLPAGVVPTPAVAYLVGKLEADAGIMISASHNPCEYNGIKLFSREGFKLPDEIENEIENLVLGESAFRTPTGGELGRILPCPEAAWDYIRHVTSTVSADFSGLRVALDCANGSASATARRLFESLGAETFLLNDRPDGININAACGSTCLEPLKAFVRERKVDLGLAFDGDADRCLAVDENGETVDGDRLMAIFAKHLKDRGELDKNTLVATVMSNLGLTRFAEEQGLTLKTAAVGDRYVLEEMLAGGYNLGGEQSGHIIFTRHATTGDGQLSGVQLMAVMKETGLPLSRLAAVMTVYPQVLVNVRVGAEGKARFGTDPEVRAEVEEAERKLGKNGRVLVRVSGTEPLIRIMAEGPDIDEIRTLAERIARTVEARLG